LVRYRRHRTGGGEIRDWYRDAVIYEVPVRAFADSDGDGIGDFRGLTGKLDYLQDLGITAVWLLPFYGSDGRDGGYDVTDYTSVHAACGTIDDFRTFLWEAHRRGIRVITELVLNHTSDRHPWFERARRAPANSVERAFYVWSEAPDRYGAARVIFTDFESSNWGWDPIAGAYYWHRFYRHQPDLNFDNPAVRREILQVVDFWLREGVDGLRLDAVPYLFERDGTACENLPETHAFIRDLRAHVDARYTGRMLLAEANQHPKDAAAYFGSGDQVHMAFHFPLMPRMFLAVASEERAPIVEVLERTPPIPSGCQWALFLRNHDELSLEMVGDEEREEMYRAYAADPRARLNLGIRRRLAPLLDNRRPLIELMNALLFSLGGTPVIYCGDEIAMGDDLSLPDRDGIRTPMRWTGDSSVEDQRRDPGSLWHWMRGLIRLHRRAPALSRGSLEVLDSGNHRVLAFLRELGEERILVLANLASSPQVAEVDLRRFSGAVPAPILGEARVPPVDGLPSRVELRPHGYAWLALRPIPLAEPASRRPSFQEAG
jgi:maltose alpha-D-glucosyltransferase / alpha-amylase